MNALSLFDGISCAQVALERAGVKVTKYYASETEKNAVKITQKNYPKTVQLGSITNWRSWDLEDIDLVIGGSPCQGFSYVGKQLNFEDPRSKLFFDLVNVINHIKPTYFLFENVVMKQEYQDIISNCLGVQPIKINSSLLSAQNRTRLYWTNIPYTADPSNKELVLRDIIDFSEQGFSLSQKGWDYMNASNKKWANGKKRLDIYANYLDKKAHCITANHAITYPNGVIPELNRRLSPLECERLQTLPDKYTEGIAMTHRYKTIGNGFTVDIIAHICKGLPLN